MKKLSLACLAVLTALVTGCPHNDYTVELTPREKVMERKLIFYRADGADTNGVPNYQSFPSNELAAITALYPPGNTTHEGERHLARGEFSSAMPGDIGGSGAYNYFSTSLGSAAIYSERFRGNDDLDARVSERLKAADQLTDLVIGWSRAELGRERGYQNLRRFLDTDFRRDLKNMTLYFWAGEVASSFKSNSFEEFIVRSGQYLRERGYVKTEDAASLVRIHSGGQEIPTLSLVRKLVADKLGVPASESGPKSLAFLADSAALDQSWKRYLAGTDLYRTQLRHWKKEKESRPDLQKPDPADAANELFSTLLNFGSSGEDDHLTVRLALAFAPDHTNGKWDEWHGWIVWNSELESAQPARRLPVFCYANWSQPNKEFQQHRFGRVVLSGDDLFKYCLWHSGLNAEQSDQWEKWLSALQPGAGLTNQLSAFEFSGEEDFGRELIKSAVERKPEEKN